jgi:hypothetical protein
VPAVAPVAEKKAAKKPKAAAAAPVVETPVVAVAPVVETPAVAETPAADTTVDTNAKLAEFGSKINQVSTLLAAMKADYKSLEKSIAKDLKNASKSKKSKKSSVPNPNRQLSGFVKPSVVSDDLLAFVGKRDRQTLETIRLLFHALRRLDRMGRLHINLDVRPRCISRTRDLCQQQAGKEDGMGF